jgi:hypothetical protein
MKVFASMSEGEAEQAVGGVLRDDQLWTQAPHPDEAPADAVWVSIEMPDVRMARYETDPVHGHRQFLIPARVTNLHQAQRVQL